MFRIAFEATYPGPVEKAAKNFYDRFDGIITERGGQITVAVYTDGTSRADEALSLIHLLEDIEFCIVRVDEDLVDAPEIAERLSLTRQAVSQWARGTRGQDFPHPVGQPGGKRIWTWGQITSWIKADYNEPTALTPDEAVQVNAYLVNRRRKASGNKDLVEASRLLVNRGGSKTAMLAGDYHRQEHRVGTPQLVGRSVDDAS